MTLALPNVCLLPELCVFCRQPSPRTPLCEGCRNDLPRLGPACLLCAEPLPAPLDLPCAACQRKRPPWQRCAAALPWAWPVDYALKALKYSRQLAFASAFGELLVEVWRREFSDCDALCPVPLYRWRHAHRGFNQATELCRPLARASALPVLTGLRRVRKTAAQSGLGRRERRRNLRAAFRLKGRLRCRHPLLVDDIMTTGETCRQIVPVLKRGGAEQVSVLVVARAAAGDQAGTTVRNV